MKVIFATQNISKLNELRLLLAETRIELVSKSLPNVPEVANTFVENALLKARSACMETGLPALADDSGLIVPALNGAPGIYSARYAGDKAVSEDNIKKLLEDMKMLSHESRSAYFYCVLVFLQHKDDPTPLICEGIWHGFILNAARGENGFGYDPIFFDPKMNVTAAELPLPIKNKMSHRGKAFRSLVEKLQCMRLP